jgi:hypothetical protein
MEMNSPLTIELLNKGSHSWSDLNKKKREDAKQAGWSKVSLTIFFSYKDTKQNYTPCPCYSSTSFFFFFSYNLLYCGTENPIYNAMMTTHILESKKEIFKKGR